MKTLFLMRHCETLFNTQHKIQGWCDSPLTEKGVFQAEMIRDYFVSNNITFDHLYSSTSERACDTLEIIVGGKYKYERLKGLKEWNFGTYEGKDEFLQPSPPIDDFFVQFGGERECDVEERFVKTIFNFMDRDTHNSVLAVSHGGTCSMFYNHWKDYNTARFSGDVPNATVFRYKYSKNTFSCDKIITFSNGTELLCSY